MKIFALAVTVFFLALEFVRRRQEEKKDAKKPADDPLSLGAVQWKGPTPSLESMRGKTVVLLIYATWCPKCNAWSGDFLGQLLTVTGASRR